MRNALLPVVLAVTLLFGSTAVASAVGETAGEARLTAGAIVFPGEARPFSIEVTNTSQLPLVGEHVDYVSVILPSAAGVTTNPQAEPPPGWTVLVTDRGGLQRLLYRTESQPIAPGSSMAFDFPADVAAPDARDRSGEFSVAVSSDGGITTEPARGDLTTHIKVLEVAALGALSPSGVTDQSATAGQSITYGVTVRNHARKTLHVTPTLVSDHDRDTIGSGDPMSISSGKARSFDIPVTLGAQSGQRTFSGGATTDGASAAVRTAQLAVQAVPRLALDASTFSPKFVRTDAPLKYAFSVRANKANPPALTLDACTLAFAGTTARLAEPVHFDTGSAAETLSFKPTRITGDEGAHTVRVSCDGVDGNGQRTTFHLTEPDLITIDNTVPAVTVGLEIPEDQDAVKNGDTLTIRGTVDEDADLDFVRLHTDGGETFPCEPSGTREFECGLSADFADGTTEVLAEAQATDRAGNVGGAASNVVDVDLIAPELVVARTLSTRQVLVEFEDEHVIRGGCDPTQWSVNGHLVTQVMFSNGDRCTTAGPPAGQSGPSGAPSNFRILVLGDALDNRDETPVVTYTKSATGVTGDDVHDGALNLADTAKVTAVPGILPPAPELVSVTRTDSAGASAREHAVKSGDGTKQDTDTYWTNQPGDDLRVEFTGARQGYQVEVVDGSGDRLGRPQEVTSDSGGGVVTVPIGRADGRYVRGLRLINAAGAGEPAYFDVVLDRITPQIDGATADGDKVTVGFTEALAFGSDFANDWFAWEKVSGGRHYYQANRVDRTDNDAERLLTVPFEDHGPFGGVDYVFTSTGSGAARYEDRAGNTLLDTTGFDSDGGGAGSGGGEPGPDDSGDDKGTGPGKAQPRGEQPGGAQADGTPREGALATTGAPLDMALWLAGLLLASGLALLTATRRAAG